MKGTYVRKNGSRSRLLEWKIRKESGRNGAVEEM